MRSLNVALLVLFLAATGSAQTAPPDHPSRRAIATPVQHPSLLVSNARIASNGDGFFAIWEDRLHDSTGALFAADGDSKSEFPVVATWQHDVAPATVWNGTEYVAFVSAGTLGVFATRVTAAGEIRGAGIPIAAAGSVSHSSLAWNGARYAYAVLAAGKLTVYFLDAALTVVREVPVGAQFIEHAEVTSDGSSFLVTWTEATGRELRIAVQLFDPAGEAASGPRIVARRSQIHTDNVRFHAAASWNGTAYLLVWGGESIEGSLVSPDGFPSVAITIADAVDAYGVQVGWDGYAHLVTWTEVTETRSDGTMKQGPAAALVTSSGELLESIAIADESIRGRAAIASNGSVFFVVWGGHRLLISSTATPRLQQHRAWVSRQYEPQSRIAAAAGEANVLVAWNEASTIYAGRLSKDGHPLDGSGIRIGRGEPPADGIEVVSGGGVYLVAWPGTGATFGVRISEQGQLIDRDPIVVSAVSGDVILAAGPNGFRAVVTALVQDPVTRVWRTTLSTATIPPSDSAVVSSDILFPSALSQRAHALFWTGTEYTVLWSQNTSPPCLGRLCPPPQHELRATSLDREGVPRETRVVALNVAPLDVVRSADGTMLMIFYEPAVGLRTQRLRSTGEPLMPPALLAGDVALPEARLAPTPSGFRALYTARPEPFPARTFDIRSVALDRDGAPRGPEVVLVRGDDAPWLEDVVTDGVQTWLLYSIGWKPRPLAHELSVRRGYVHVLTPRRRGVSHDSSGGGVPNEY